MQTTSFDPCNLVRATTDWLFRAPQSSAQAACGCALASSYAYLETREHTWIERTERCLQIALDVRARSVGLHGGITEIGWTLAHIDSLRIVALSPEQRVFLSALDRYVEELASDAAVRFDLINGLAGFALYANERWAQSARATEILGNVVMSLERRAVRDACGTYWYDAAEGEPPWLDVGVAHGLAGLLFPLALATHRDVHAEVAQRLFKEAAATLMRHALRDDGRTVEGISLVYPERIHLPREPRGWCYGGLGLAAIAQTVGDFSGEQDLVEWSRRVCVGALDDAGPMSGRGLCHGSAGAAVLYQRLSGDEFSAAASAELLRATAPKEEERGFHGTCKVEGPRTADLLTGASGIAMAHFSSTCIMHGWERILGLAVVPSMT